MGSPLPGDSFDVRPQTPSRPTKPLHPEVDRTHRDWATLFPSASVGSCLNLNNLLCATSSHPEVLPGCNPASTVRRTKAPDVVGGCLSCLSWRLLVAAGPVQLPAAQDLLLDVEPRVVADLGAPEGA